MYVVTPTHPFWQRNIKYDGQPVPDGFIYASNTNPVWLTPEQIRDPVAPFDADTLREAES